MKTCIALLFPVVLSSALVRGQYDPARGTWGDRPYMFQMSEAGKLGRSLGKGESKGLSIFFKESDYFSSIQHGLDSLAGAWRGQDNGSTVEGMIDGEFNRMRVTVFDRAGHDVLGQIVLYYSPKDPLAQAIRMDIVPTEQIVFDDQDWPEEPPPTQEELEKHQNR